MRVLRSGRVLLVDARERILLFHVEIADRRGTRVWLTPGGVREPGESWADAARRELWEETGLDGVELGPCVWKREHVYEERGGWYRSVERFFLARVESWQPAPAALEPLEREHLLGHRWWSVPDIRGSAATFVPRRLGALLEPLLAGELPAEPIDCGI